MIFKHATALGEKSDHLKPLLGRKGAELHSAGKHVCGGLILRIGDQGYEECAKCGAWCSERSLRANNTSRKRPGRYAVSHRYPGQRRLKRLS